MHEIAGKRVIGVCGFKNSGKTTLVEKLVRELTSRGLRIATIKHAHHSFDIDTEGKDSFRHRAAGASQVAVVSRERVAVMTELRGAEAPCLAQVVRSLEPCDLVIVEGYKRDGHDKIEVRNLAFAHPALAGDDASVVAIAANGAIADAPVPVFDRDDVTALAGFIVRHCRLDVPELLVRRAGPGDAVRVRELTRAAYAKWVPVIGREPKPMTADYDAAVRSHWIDMATSGSELAGLIEMIPKPDCMVIENLAVADHWQRRGVGSRLLAHAENLAQLAGLPCILLYTNSRFTTNLRYYDSRGYVEDGRSLLPDGGTMVHFRKVL